MAMEMVDKIAMEAVRIRKDYPELSYVEVIKMAKEVVGYELDRRRIPRAYRKEK